MAKNVTFFCFLIKKPIFVTEFTKSMLKIAVMKNANIIIRTLREQLGYSQDAVANFLKVKREMVSYYETGARELPLGVLEKLADLFGVDLEIFFTDNVEDVNTELAFAFRANELNENDLESIAAFRKIIKNYQRITNLEKRDA
ncbi:MAG: helix-turn-helix transcriptional regulator [Phycisphaerales bacterium]|nr:helix-turn-helix transcriptional regulator [Phycisphaerales bacterium]